MDIWKAWSITLKVVDPRYAKKTLEQQVEKADLVSALKIYLFAGVYFFLLTMLLAVLTLYTVRAVYVIAGIDLPELELTNEILMPYATYYGLFFLPLTIIITVISQYLSCKIANVLGGTGNFTKQFYLYSFLTLGLTLGSTLMIAMFFSCFGQIIIVLVLLFMLYVQFYLHILVIRVAHKLSVPRSIATVLMATIISIALYILITNGAASVGIAEPLVNETLKIPNQIGGEYAI